MKGMERLKELVDKSKYSKGDKIKIDGLSARVTNVHVDGENIDYVTDKGHKGSASVYDDDLRKI